MLVHIKLYRMSMKHEDFHFNLIEQKICIFVKCPDYLNIIEPRSLLDNCTESQDLGIWAKTRIVRMDL